MLPIGSSTVISMAFPSPTSAGSDTNPEGTSLRCTSVLLHKGTASPAGTDPAPGPASKSTDTAVMSSITSLILSSPAVRGAYLIRALMSTCSLSIKTTLRTTIVSTLVPSPSMNATMRARASATSKRHVASPARRSESSIFLLRVCVSASTAADIFYSRFLTRFSQASNSRR